MRGSEDIKYISYIRQPSQYIQPDLFSIDQGDIYATADFPLFFDTLIKWQFNENSYFLASKDNSFLIVSGFGTIMSKKSERLIIKDGAKVIYEIPFFRLQNVAVLSKGVLMSSDLLESFAKNNVNVSFHLYSGKPYSILQSMQSPHYANLKKLQISMQDSSRALSLIKQIIRGKIFNSSAVLKYAVKNLSDTDEKSHFKIQSVKNACKHLDSISETVHEFSQIQNFEQSKYILMGYEGSASRIYWKVISGLLSDRINFEGRRHKFPKDIVNVLLNYGYGILYAKIWSAIAMAGLDAYIGFLHSDQDGKTALVFDLIEEFRAPIVDRTVLSFLMQNKNIQISQGLLSLETRESFSQKLLDRLSSAQYYESKSIMFSDILLMQARKIASFILGKQEEYAPFKFKW